MPVMQHKPISILFWPLLCHK